MAEASAGELTVNLTQLIGILAIILSVVALVVTVLGFFASLGFYRHGVNLQKNAESVLAKIEEKASSIQSQIGGMFEKTLDAAIANNKQISTEFDAIDEKIEKVKTEIVRQVQSEIGTAEKTEQAEFKGVVEQELKDLKKLVVSARESATTPINPSIFQEVTIPPYTVSAGVLQKFLEMDLKKINVKIKDLTTKGSIAFVTTDKPINIKTTRRLLLIADKFGYNLQVGLPVIPVTDGEKNTSADN